MTGDADQTEELSEYKRKYFTSRGLNPKNLDLLPKTKDVFDGLSDDDVKKLDELGTALEDDLKHGGGVPPEAEGEIVAYAEEAEVGAGVGLVAPVRPTGSAACAQPVTVAATSATATAQRPSCVMRA